MQRSWYRRDWDLRRSGMMYMLSYHQSQYSVMHTPDSLPPSAKTYRIHTAHKPSYLHLALRRVHILCMFGDFHPQCTDHHSFDTHLSSSIWFPHSWCTLIRPHSVPPQLHRQSTVHEHHCQTRQPHLVPHMPGTQHRMVNRMLLGTRRTMCVPRWALRLADKLYMFDVHCQPHLALHIFDTGLLLSMSCLHN